MNKIELKISGDKIVFHSDHWVGINYLLIEGNDKEKEKKHSNIEREVVSPC